MYNYAPENTPVISPASTEAVLPPVDKTLAQAEVSPVSSTGFNIQDSTIEGWERIEDKQGITIDESTRKRSNIPPTQVAPAARPPSQPATPNVGNRDEGRSRIFIKDSTVKGWEHVDGVDGIYMDEKTRQNSGLAPSGERRSSDQAPVRPEVGGDRVVSRFDDDLLLALRHTNVQFIADRYNSFSAAERERIRDLVRSRGAGSTSLSDDVDILFAKLDVSLER